MFSRIQQVLLANRRLFSKRNIVIVILFGIGLSLFLSIYDGIQEQDDLALYDAPLLAWAIASYNAHLATFLRVITDLSSPVALSIFTIVSAVIWAWRKKDFWRPAVFVGAMTLAYIASAIIKLFTARARPTVTDLLEAHGAISYSFPSGHTLGIAVLLFVLGYFFCSYSPTPRRLILWAIGTFIGVVLVAFSRIYLGYHWLTDVTASVGLAFIVLAIVITIDTYAPRRKVATSKEA